MQQICQERIFNVPNVLTLIRIALLPVVAWFFRMGNMVGALIVYLIAMLTDLFDGAIARRTNQITSLGKLLDPIADKLSMLTLLTLFVGNGQIPLWVLLVVLLKETLMVAGSSVALRHGVIVYALPIGKATTFVFTASIVLRFLRLTLAADVLLYLSVILTLAAFFLYLRNMMVKLDEQKCLHAAAMK